MCLGNRAKDDVRCVYSGCVGGEGGAYGHVGRVKWWCQRPYCPPRLCACMWPQLPVCVPECSPTLTRVCVCA